MSSKGKEQRHQVLLVGQVIRLLHATLSAPTHKLLCPRKESLSICLKFLVMMTPTTTDQLVNLVVAPNKQTLEFKNKTVA